jgi:CheY-like chemotaxis protein
MATVLMVEDDVLLADCYVRWLHAAKHTVWHVGNAQDAIDVVNTTPPDVILLDMLLPGVNGIQLLHTLRSHTDLARIPIIMCSGALPERMPDVHAYGVVATLDKSTLTRERLQEAIYAATV